MQVTIGRAWRGLSTAAAFAGTLAVAGTALASECPADKVKANAQSDDGKGAKGVTDNVLSMIDLAQEKIRANGYTMRVRRLVVQPGGIVPWHSHAERPAMVYLVQGEMTEFRIDCAVPIVHKAGSITRETHLISHRWRNNGAAAAVLLSFDIVKDLADRNM
jgi:quercetin dioxygenase-like cupin family protein